MGEKPIAARTGQYKAHNAPPTDDEIFPISLNLVREPIIST
jgi:hypothetical protein